MPVANFISAFRYKFFNPGQDSYYKGKKPINNLTADKCRITKNNEDYEGQSFRRPANHLEHKKCKITQNYDVYN